jgi:uncharacterized membrane protein HdeD (DUF308 family)
MELTVYLSQVLGLFLIICGIAIMVRRSYFAPVVGGFVEDRLTRMIVGVLELLAGLFLATAHTDWSTLPASIITAIGWLLVMEGTGYLLLSDKQMTSIIKMANNRVWYVFGGCLSIVLGAYLAFFGFGLM